MPTSSQIQKAIRERKNSGQDFIRRGYLRRLAKYTGRDTILYASAYSLPNNSGGHPASSLLPGDIQGFMAALHGLNGDKLDLILHSPGGSMEAAEQVVSYLRAKYKHIRAVVPQNAMSAATMIACACDEIVMGKHSAIGPIDPQVTFVGPNQRLATAPAQSIIDEFEQAKAEIKADPSQGTATIWLTKIKDYPHGFIRQCQIAMDQSRLKVEEWLVAYMLRGDADAALKAKAIADWLGDPKIHKSHGRPISCATAMDKGLKIVALEDDQKLQELVLSVHHATMTTFQATSAIKIIENQNGRGHYLNSSPNGPA